MANPAVQQLQKSAEENRGEGFLKVKDGETLEVKKLQESVLDAGKFGTQAVYLVETADGKKIKLAFKIGHPAIPPMEEIKTGAKVRIKRTGSTQQNTRYEITAL